VADIKNYTLNFVFGRRASLGLTCAVRKLAYEEVQLSQAPFRDCGFDDGR
jgi:hypothetical protein